MPLALLRLRPRMLGWRSMIPRARQGLARWELVNHRAGLGVLWCWRRLMHSSPRRLVLIALIPLELDWRPARRGVTRYRSIDCRLHKLRPRRDDLVRHRPIVRSTDRGPSGCAVEDTRLN